MQKAMACDLDPGFLDCKTRFSDRYVFSRYFVPLDVTYDDRAPILTHHQRAAVAAYAAGNPRAYERMRAEQPSTFERNDITPAYVEEMRRARVREAPGGHHDHGGHHPSRRGRDCLSGEDFLEVARLLQVVGARVDAQGRDLVDVIESKVRRMGQAHEETEEERRVQVRSSSHAMMVAGRDRGVMATHVPERHDVQRDVESIINLTKSEIGYLFLDRTRIRPKGFSLGEHVFTLGLAPGEEVVLEQKAFSKRQTTLEDQTERERQFDLELSSTLSTELQEGVEREQNRKFTEGLNANGNLGYTDGGLTVGVTAAATRNAEEASAEASRRSIKDSHEATTKVASKYRTLHKVTFKLSTEEGFESTSKRVIRNPSRHVPISLHYFKILRILEMTQERTGARLAWSPCVKDPGFDLAERVRKGREAIAKKHEDALALPSRPTPPARADKPPVWRTGTATAGDWGLTCDMRAEYDVGVQIPAGYRWDGDEARIHASLRVITNGVNRPVNAYAYGSPWIQGDTLYVKVHVGVGSAWSCGTIQLEIGANFVALPDSEYAAAYAAYEAELRAWEAKAADQRQQARENARKEADAWEATLLREMNPLRELMNRVIGSHFPGGVRDECWEIELWQRVFEWEHATYALYPAWWSDLPIRDPSRDDTHFWNASWARLYIPVRPGHERLALRWIHGRLAHTPMHAAAERVFERIEGDLNEFRRRAFGSDQGTNLREHDGCTHLDEKTLCLGMWAEVAPTDGTHVEVVQGATTALDEATRLELDDQNKLRNAVIESERQDVAIKKKVLAQLIAPTTVQVNVATDGRSG